MKTFKNVPSVSLVLLAVIATVSNFALAKDPDAESCWRYTQGLHMQQGGSPDKQDCTGKEYCYLARKAQAQNNEEQQGAHATRRTIVGGCAGPDSPILSHPGINKDKTPSCSEQTHNGNDQVCVCNKDDCNKLDKMDDMLKKSKSLGSGNGSQNLGYNLVLTVSALMTTIFFRV